jgi:hypothetical protein
MPYRHYCFCDPAVPLALAPAVRFSRHRTAAVDCLSWRPHPLVELHLPLEYYPATPTRPPQRPSPLMGFCSLQHIRNSRSTSRGPKPARYVPPSGFGYPLDGLLPRIPCRFCFTPAALLGFTLRRFPLPRGLAGLSAGRNPPTVESGSISAARRLRTGPTDLGSWARASRECLATTRGIKPATAGASHGVCPSRACHGNLDPDFSGPPLTRFAGRAITRQTRRRLRVSIGLRSASPDTHRSAHQPRQPFWGFRTCLILSIWAKPASGLLSSPRIGPCIAADSPMLLGHQRHPAEAVQDPSWVPSIAIMLVIGASPGDGRHWDAVREWARQLPAVLLGDSSSPA